MSTKIRGKGVAEEQVEELAEQETELELPVKPIRQDEKWDCGPTAIRIDIRYMFGLKLTAKDMILLSGATEGGTDEYNMMRALDVLGFKYVQSENGTLNILKKRLRDGQPSIVHLVMNDGGGHYMVLKGYKGDEWVKLADPATGKIVKYGTPFFLGVWKIEEGETQTRWYLTIIGHVGDRFDSLIQRLKRIQKKVRNSRK